MNVLTGPQEVEDNQPDKKSLALNSDGSTRRQHDAELYDDDGDVDQTPTSAGSKRRLLDKEADVVVKEEEHPMDVVAEVGNED
jgi:hypothetical protein